MAVTWQAWQALREASVKFLKTIHVGSNQAVERKKKYYAKIHSLLQSYMRGETKALEEPAFLNEFLRGLVNFMLLCHYDKKVDPSTLALARPLVDDVEAKGPVPLRPLPIPEWASAQASRRDPLVWDEDDDDLTTRLDRRRVKDVRDKRNVREIAVDERREKERSPSKRYALKDQVAVTPANAKRAPGIILYRDAPDLGATTPVGKPAKARTRRPRSQPASDGDGDDLGSDGEVSRSKTTWASAREPVRALLKAQRLFESCRKDFEEDRWFRKDVLDKHYTEASVMYRALAAWVEDERFLSRSMQQKTQDYKKYAHFFCHFHQNRDKRKAFNALQLPPLITLIRRPVPRQPTADEIRLGLYQTGLDPKPRNRALEEAMKEPKRRSRSGSSSRKTKPSPAAARPGSRNASPAAAARRNVPPPKKAAETHLIGSRSWSPQPKRSRSPLKTFKRDKKP